MVAISSASLRLLSPSRLTVPNARWLSGPYGSTLGDDFSLIVCWQVELAIARAFARGREQGVRIVDVHGRRWFANVVIERRDYRVEWVPIR